MLLDSCAQEDMRKCITTMASSPSLPWGTSRSNVLQGTKACVGKARLGAVAAEVGWASARKEGQRVAVARSAGAGRTSVEPRSGDNGACGGTEHGAA